MHFIGDIHGCMEVYMPIIASLESSIQVGDFGVGFCQLPSIPLSHRFLRGNHDNPTLCQSIPNYLGDFGFDGEVFFVSGANSIDKHLRIPGVDWWPEEQLSYSQMNECLTLYESVKPDIVASHDCPTTVQHAINPHYIPDSTNALLQEMLSIHAPSVWVFGHYHRSIDLDWTTQFIGLKEFEVREI